MNRRAFIQAASALGAFLVAIPKALAAPKVVYGKNFVVDRPFVIRCGEKYTGCVFVATHRWEGPVVIVEPGGMLQYSSIHGCVEFQCGGDEQP